MDKTIISELSKRLSLKESRIETVLGLLEDNTVPFIARYRKEMTGSMDEETIRDISKAYSYQNQLKERKEQVIRLIDEKGLLDDALKASIEAARQLVEIEDLYRPFKEKKKTKATIAQKKGLKPLADTIMAFEMNADLKEAAKAYIKEDVPTVDEALEGAMHIIAELVSDDAKSRKWIRNQTFSHGVIETKKKKDADDPKGIYEMYYDFQTPVKQIKSFRVLAINRGEQEKVLRVKITGDKPRITTYLERQYVVNDLAPSSDYVKSAIEDAYKRLIAPSIERELRSELTEKAEDGAIEIFAENLQSLLLSPPLKDKVVLGIDPAFRTGCKLAVLDTMGSLKEVDVIYPHPKNNGKPLDEDALKPSFKTVERLVSTYGVDVIAIGNGTASRETERFIVDAIKKMDQTVYYTIVNEAGASVYSASQLAKQEFPDLQVEERSAINIARRLQDPLSELVKIDPKSIGVGQYQHDVSQSKLSDSLDFTVETAVNRVGVDANVASAALLTYVAGISKKVANAMIDHRETKGAFTNRKQLKNVKGLGAKSYEQSVGFLRIIKGEEPLDKTPIHPESYDDAKQILTSIDADSSMLGSEALKEKLAHVKAEDFVEVTKAGIPTINDILDALKSPMRDPRDQAPAPILKSDVLALSDLKEGMKLQGTVRNVVDFGAFVDCGVKEDGLVHISKLSTSFVKHPMDVVKVGDIVDVWVEGVDMKRSRLQLSMVDPTKK